MLIITNVLVIISSLIMMIQHLAAIWIGRILRGVISGIVSVTVLVFINEIAIKKYKTIQLGLINFFVAIGIFSAYMFRLTVPEFDIGK